MEIVLLLFSVRFLAFMYFNSIDMVGMGVVVSAVLFFLSVFGCTSTALPSNKSEIWLVGACCERAISINQRYPNIVQRKRFCATHNKPFCKQKGSALNESCEEACNHWRKVTLIATLPPSYTWADLVASGCT